MNDYTFSTLNDKDFELLSLDLLNAKFKLNLQSFKGGKDKGVDLRYSSSKSNNKIIVQVKHYAGSKYSTLKSKLKLSELPKVKNLNPTRYIVVTSLKLTATEKDEIKGIFKPYILTSEDVIAGDDLNNYLREFVDIEKNHYKLWFSSVGVLSSILNNAVEGRTKSHLNKIQKKIPYYVQTKNFIDAKLILDKEKILLISGDPGVGKTTLADVLLLNTAKEGYKVYKINNIREAEDMIREDDKQVFYFDDFLGEVYYEVTSGSQKESEIKSFIERILYTDNKYMILTTRTVILTQAVLKSENIRRSLLDTGRYEIKINDYSQFEKAQILYNHLYHNFEDKDHRLFETIIKDKFYRRIIMHTSYNPRIIEFITDLKRVGHMSDKEYRAFIINNLDEPQEIWRTSFENQISYFDRCLLITMFIIGGNINEKLLIKEFESRIKYEKDENNQQIGYQQFEKSISTLLDGFIISTIDASSKRRTYKFVNPSLADFILSHLKSSSNAIKSILKSVVFVEHLHFFNPYKKNFILDKEDRITIKKRIQSRELKSLDSNSNKRNTKIILTLFDFCLEQDIDDVIYPYFINIDFAEPLYNLSRDLSILLENLHYYERCREYIEVNFYKIIFPYLKTLTDEDEFLAIPDIFSNYDKDYDKFISITENFDFLVELVGGFLEGYKENIVHELKKEITHIDQIENIFDELNDSEYKISRKLFPDDSIDFGVDREIDSIELEDAINDNLHDVHDWEERRKAAYSSDKNHGDGDIDELFK